MTAFFHSLLEKSLGLSDPRPRQIESINRRRAELRGVDDEALRKAFESAAELTDGVAAVAVAAQRVLGLEMFDVQLQGALAMAEGRIAEMQTGEGKTLAAVPAVAWLARSHGGVHVMTVNDYLARRDAAWMGGIYRMLGLSVGCIQQGMASPGRKLAYLCDVTYSTANEAGFDYLRDQIAWAKGSRNSADCMSSARIATRAAASITSCGGAPDARAIRGHRNSSSPPRMI